MTFTREMLQTSYEDLTGRSKLDLDFVILTASASIICAIGFRMNSASVIVGAMLLSPLLYPVICIGAATFHLDRGAFARAFVTFAAGVIAAVVIAISVSLMFPSLQRSEIVDRFSTEMIDYFIVAFFSGLAGTYAFFSPKIHEAIAGIAISVALIPPVVMLGIATAQQDAGLALASGMIAACNVLGIYIGSVVTVAGLHLSSGDSAKS